MANSRTDADHKDLIERLQFIADHGKSEVISEEIEEVCLLAVKALQSESGARDTARLDWLEKNPRKVNFAEGYRGDKGCWMWSAAHVGHQAESLREAIDSARHYVGEEKAK